MTSDDSKEEEEANEAGSKIALVLVGVMLVITLCVVGLWFAKAIGSM